ncbi:MAG: DHH family phosphoesterase [Candidatus Omnitrophota bacterium]
MNGLKGAVRCIKRARTIAVAGHVNPDGDSIGSLLSLGLGLEKLGKRVYMVSSDGVPKKYATLPGARRIITDTDRKVDLAIAVDCSNREILGRAFRIFERAGEILEIDHHDFRRPFCDVCFIEPRAGAVGEMIYILLKKLRAPITPSVAQSLMTSIIVETSSFRLPGVRPFTFEACNDLIRKGVNFYKLVDTVFWSMSRESVILSGICLARCKFIKRGKVVWSHIGIKDFKAVRGKDEDVDAVADDMRAIKGVDIAVLFREKDRETIRVSLRSKHRINIAKIAEYYGGGGHFDVAGCSIPNSAAAINDLLSRTAALP